MTNTLRIVQVFAILFIIAGVAFFFGYKRLISQADNSESQTTETKAAATKTATAKSTPKSKLSEPVTVPPKMLDAELQAADGTTFKLSDYKGKVVLLNIWATWCGYCKQEMPDLVKFSQEYKDDVVVIGLDGDENETAEQIKTYAAKNGITYQMGLSNDDVLEVLQPRGLPSSYIINRDGKFTWAISGLIPAARMKTKIEEALNN